MSYDSENFAQSNRLLDFAMERVLSGVFAGLEFFDLFIDDRNKGKNG